MSNANRFLLTYALVRSATSNVDVTGTVSGNEILMILGGIVIVGTILYFITEHFFR